MQRCASESFFLFFFGQKNILVGFMTACHCNLREDLHNPLKAQDALLLPQKYLVGFASLDFSCQLCYLCTFVLNSVRRMLCQIDISIRMHPCVACTVSITSKHRTPNAWRSVTPSSRHFAIFGNCIGCHLKSWSLRTEKALFALPYVAVIYIWSSSDF